MRRSRAQRQPRVWLSAKTPATSPRWLRAGMVRRGRTRRRRRSAARRARSLVGISCPQVSLCTAVGYAAVNPGKEVPIAEQWDGHGCTIQTVPMLDRATSAVLNGVSCSAPDACTAVGYSTENISYSGAYTALVERWDGTRWTIQTADESWEACKVSRVRRRLTASRSARGTAGPSSGTGRAGESCRCRRMAPSAMRWNRFPASPRQAAWAWATSGTPIPAPSTPHHGTASRGTQVPMPSPTGSNYASWTPGFVPDRRRVRSGWVLDVWPDCSLAPFADRWNGESWTLENHTLPSGAHTSVLKGVSCPTAMVCVGVGSSNDGDTMAGTLTWTVTVPLAEIFSAPTPPAPEQTAPPTITGTLEAGHRSSRNSTRPGHTAPPSAATSGSAATWTPARACRSARRRS